MIKLIGVFVGSAMIGLSMAFLVTRMYRNYKRRLETEMLLLKALEYQVQATISAYREFKTFVAPLTNIDMEITERIMRLQSMKENYVEKWIRILEIKRGNKPEKTKID